MDGPAEAPSAAPDAPTSAEPAARRSTRRPVPKAPHDASPVASSARRTAGGSAKRETSERGARSAAGGGAHEADSSQPPRKRLRATLFPSGATPAAGADGGGASGAPGAADAHADAGGSGDDAGAAGACAGGAARAATSGAVPPAGTPAVTPTTTPRRKGGGGGGGAKAAASGGGGARRGGHGPRKSHALEEDELLRQRGRGKRASPKPTPRAAADAAPPQPQPPQPQPGAPRPRASCPHLIDAPWARAYAALHHLLCARPRRWCFYEWFYAPIDRAFFKPAVSDFQACLAECGLGHVSRLTRAEWSFVRALIGRPRRASAAFFAAERGRLGAHRAAARARGVGRLAVGQRVLAFHPRVRQLHAGAILTPAGAGYKVQFARHELGVQTVGDHLLDAEEEASALPPGGAALGAGGAGALAYAEVGFECALRGGGGGGGGGGGAARRGAASLGELGACGGGVCATLPGGAHASAARAAARTAELQLGLEARRLLERKQLTLAELEATNGAVESGELALGAEEERPARAEDEGQETAQPPRAPKPEPESGAADGSAQPPPAGSAGAEAAAGTAGAPPSERPAAAAAAAAEADSAETVAVKCHYHWLLDSLERTNAQLEPVLSRLRAAARERARADAAAAALGGAGSGGTPPRAVSELAHQCSASAVSIVQDALRTTAAAAAEQRAPTPPAAAAAAAPISLPPMAEQLVTQCVALLLRVRALAGTDAGAEDVLLLLESSLAEISPKVGGNAGVFREVRAALSSISSLLKSAAAERSAAAESAAMVAAAGQPLPPPPQHQPTRESATAAGAAGSPQQCQPFA